MLDLDDIINIKSVPGRYCIMTGYIRLTFGVNKVLLNIIFVHAVRSR